MATMHHARQADATTTMHHVRSADSTTPVPDPTYLTSLALSREISALREVLEARITGVSALIEARLNGMDKAITLLQTISDRLPELMDRRVESLQKLHEERFSSIQTQFTERDTRTEQTSRDSKVAVDAALQAAKEAVGEQNKSSALAIAKSEAATTKQIDQQAMLITTATGALNDKIEDLKERLGRMESVSQGRTEQKVSARDDTKLWMAVLGVVLTVIGLLAGYLFRR